MKHTPEEHQDGLRKGLKVVVAIDLRSVDHGYFPKNLKTQIKSTNFLLSLKAAWFLTAALIRRSNHLHPNYSIDEEEHGYQESNIGKSLVGGKREACRKLYAVENWRTSPLPSSVIN